MRSTSSPRAVSMMIGICDSARTLRHRLRPSSPGSITSRIRRSTRWSVIARTISRPSFAVVTLQALVRRYFAISVRVSRSSSTTRMFGDAVAMTTFVGDSQASMKEFCFEMFLASPSQHGATSRSVDKKASLSSAALPSRRLLKNLRSHHDLNARDLQPYLPVASAETAGRAADPSKFRRHQLDRPERVVLGAERHRLLAARRPVERSVRRHTILSRRSEVEDRRPYCLRSVQRQIDQ